MQEAKIDNWYIVDLGEYAILAGTVFDHPDFDNGTEIRSSLIIEYDKDNKRVVTKNTTYSLLDGLKEKLF